MFLIILLYIHNYRMDNQNQMSLWWCQTLQGGGEDNYENAED